MWWFGGGMDLTPYYGNKQDAKHFHQTCHDALAPYGVTQMNTPLSPIKVWEAIRSAKAA